MGHRIKGLADVKINGISLDATGKNFICKDEQLAVTR